MSRSTSTEAGSPPATPTNAGRPTASQVPAEQSLLRPSNPRPEAFEGTSGVQAAYGKRLARLTALKVRHDPDNVFRFNANIPPSPPVIGP